MVWKRGSVNPLAFLANIAAVRRVYRALDPDLVHHVACSRASSARWRRADLRSLRLNALTGLGFAFSSQTPKARLMRPLLRALLRHVLGHPRASVLVQNGDDRAAVEALGIDAGAHRPHCRARASKPTG